MTKKDYIILAQALRREIGGGYLQIVDNIADALSRDNEKFNRAKFFDACGVLPPEAETQKDNFRPCGCRKGWPHISNCINSEFSKKHN